MNKFGCVFFAIASGVLFGLYVSHDLETKYSCVEGNDIITSKGSEVNNLKEGIWIFKKNDNLIQISNFKNNKLNGVTYTFFDNGNIRSIFDMEENMIHGNILVYSKDNNYVGHLTFKFGLLNRIIYIKSDDEIHAGARNYFPKIYYTDCDDSRQPQ